MNDRYVAGGRWLVLTLVWLAYLVGVFVFQRGLTGRTVGTMLTGVAVVGPDGRPLGPAKALLRSVAGVVDYLPCCLPLVGFVTVLASPGPPAGGRHGGRQLRRRQPRGSAVRSSSPVRRCPRLPPWPHPTGTRRNRRSPAAPPVRPLAPGSPGTERAGRVPVAPGAGARGPVWDPERRAYLQWDPTRQQWLQFEQATQTWQQYDAASGRWRPVDR